MDLDEARAFLQKHHRGVLATRRADSGIQQSPVVVNVDGEGRAIISSRETAYKVRNLRRDPWAQACIFTDGFFGQWLFFEGTAEVLSLPEAMDPLIDYYKRFPAAAFRPVSGSRPTRHGAAPSIQMISQTYGRMIRRHEGASTVPFDEQFRAGKVEAMSLLSARSKAVARAQKRGPAISTLKPPRPRVGPQMGPRVEECRPRSAEKLPTSRALAR